MTFPPWLAAHMNAVASWFAIICAVGFAWWWGYIEGRAVGRRAQLSALMRMIAATAMRDPKTGRFTGRKMP